LGHPFARLSPTTAESVARRLGIEKVEADVRPEDKEG
jgi:cation transport ATPase